MKYFPINEDLARRANEMNSFFEYVPGRATQSYRAEVDEAAALAERQKQRVDPMYHEKIDGLLDAFARKLADNINHRNSLPIHLALLPECTAQPLSQPAQSNAAIRGSADSLRRRAWKLKHSAVRPIPLLL